MYSKSIFSHDEILQNFHSVKERMSAAAQSVGRDINDVHLIVVTKTFDSTEIHPLIDYGHRDFGENRVQEAEQKWSDLKNDKPLPSICLEPTLSSSLSFWSLDVFLAFLPAF